MRAKPASPLYRLLDARGLRVVQVAATAGVAVETVHRVGRLDKLEGLKLGSLVKIANALGVAPSDLVPGLASRPRGKAPLG